ncbi:hypothetical protein ACH5A3_32595 [Streptomyces echinatus]
MSEIISGVEIPDTAAAAEATRLMQKMTSDPGRPGRRRVRRREPRDA